MPEQQVIVLKLFYEEGMDYKNISSVLDLPYGTVASLLHRARITLRTLEDK
jgi:DNA-directed RNA polymerase specialized sigma24 family protein